MANVPSILINRTRLNCEFTAELLGDCDEILQMISCYLGWMQEVAEFSIPTFVAPNVWVFSNESGFGTSVVESGRSRFLVSRVLEHRDEFGDYFE
jgi:NAD-dependent histone deacetylase SIR2/NAD-dependent deacetylase sirtuin 1